MVTTTNAHRDRFLQRRGERWHYVRRVPAHLAGADPRGTRIRLALRTDDLAVARAMRDALEKADHDLWAALLAGDDAVGAVNRYAAAARRACALGFGYRPAAELAAKASWQELAERMEAIRPIHTPHVTEKAILGGEPEPSVPLSQALKVYVDEIAASRLVTKSVNQRRKWKVIPERAVRSFREVVGDKPIGEITRADAHTFYRWWRDRIAPQEKGARSTHTPSSGNRQIGALRALYRDYFVFMGEPDRDNPFTGLNFEERTKTKRTRPPFPTAWIRDKMLKAPALRGLNEQARAILMASIETGARPSELCNLKEEHIFAHAEVPYISITERDDPDSPRELKTGASIREIPLVGAALAAFRKFPEGFPRYFEKEEAACAAINKYLRENKLVPSPKHTLYSLRHAFEDRMKEVGIDEEMREIFFGHRRTRQEYGSGGALAWRRTLLERLALPFDPDLL